MRSVSCLFRHTPWCCLWPRRTLSIRPPTPRPPCGTVWHGPPLNPAPSNPSAMYDDPPLCFRPPDLPIALGVHHWGFQRRPPTVHKSDCWAEPRPILTALRPVGSSPISSRQFQLVFSHRQPWGEKKIANNNSIYSWFLLNCTAVAADTSADRLSRRKARRTFYAQFCRVSKTAAFWFGLACFSQGEIPPLTPRTCADVSRKCVGSIIKIKNKIKNGDETS